MHKPKITFLDSFSVNPGDLNWDVLNAEGALTTFDRTSDADVVTRSQGADVIITNKVKLNSTHFRQLPDLKLICVAATGYDPIDTVQAREHGITVCNCPNYSTMAVAQMVLALLLEATNNVGFYAEANHKGYWTDSLDFCRWENPIAELAGKKAAVVGFGHIGQAVTEILRPFGVRLFAVSSKPQENLPADVQKISLDEAFRTCDIVSLHCPLTASNAGLVNAGLLAQANPNLILINTARGKLIDEAAVADALKSHRLKAFCCDVLSQEPPTADNPLLSAPNSYITPHIAWASSEARRRILQILAGNIRAFFGGNPVNVVN